MPSNNRDLILVPLEAIEFRAELTNVKYLDLVVTTACQEPVAIDRVPAYLVDGRIVCVDLVNVPTSETRVPNLNILVFAASQDERLGRVPVTRLEIRPMLRKLKLLCRCHKVEYFGPTIIST